MNPEILRQEVVVVNFPMGQNEWREVDDSHDIMLSIRIIHR